MLEQTLAAFLVLILLVGILWLLRRKGLATINLPLARRTNQEKELQVMERVSLSAHHSLHLVRVQNQTILIGISPSGCCQIALPSDAAEPRCLGPAE